MIKARPDPGGSKACQCRISQVSELDGLGVVPLKGGFGPVGRAAAGRGDDQRLLAGRFIRQYRSGVDEFSTPGLRQLHHGVKKVQAHAANQDGLAWGDLLPVHVRRYSGRQVPQAKPLS
jgi:hypothetical protein